MALCGNPRLILVCMSLALFLSPSLCLSGICLPSVGCLFVYCLSVSCLLPTVYLLSICLPALFVVCLFTVYVCLKFAVCLHSDVSLSTCSPCSLSVSYLPTDSLSRLFSLSVCLLSVCFLSAACPLYVCCVSVCLLSLLYVYLLSACLSAIGCMSTL